MTLFPTATESNRMTTPKKGKRRRADDAADLEQLAVTPKKPRLSYSEDDED
jgi:hypothetical protein